MNVNNESSLSQSMSKVSLSEEMSITDAALSDPGMLAPCSISTESIRKGEELLGTYIVESDEIQGGMGSVWRVRHTGWGMDLAMKRPQPGFFAEASLEQKEKFVRECENWIQLGLHPHIVSCYYVRGIGGVPSVFSEWMDNGSLKDHILDRTLYKGSPDEVVERLLDIAIQTLRGLGYSHQKGLYHQDIKPGNLLLSKDWEAKVADFGLSRAKALLLTDKDKKHVSGTPKYYPREQKDGETAQAWMDIYSWALTVLEAFAGECLWEEGPDGADHAREYVMAARIPLTDGVSDEGFEEASDDESAGKSRSGLTDEERNGRSIPKDLADLLVWCLTGKPDAVDAVVRRLEEIYQAQTGRRYPRRLPEETAVTADILNNHALSFLDLGKPLEAKKRWLEALRLDPNCMNAAYNAAVFSWRQGEISAFDAERRIRDIHYKSRQDPEITRREEELRLPSRNSILAQRVRAENKMPRGMEKAHFYRSSVSVIKAATADGRYAVVSYWDAKDRTERFLELDLETAYYLHDKDSLSEWDLPEADCDMVAISRGGMLAAAHFSEMGDADHQRIAIWELPSGREIQRVVYSDAKEIMFDRSGKYLVSLGRKGGLAGWTLPFSPPQEPSSRMKLPNLVLRNNEWHIRTICPGPGEGLFWLALEESVELYDLPARACLKKIPLPSGFHTYHLTVSDDGKVLAASDCRISEGKCLRIAWNTENGSLLLNLETRALTASPAALSPDGRWLAMTEQFSLEDKYLQVADLLAASPQVFSISLGRSSFSQIHSFTPDGSGMVMESMNRLFTMETNWDRSKDEEEDGRKRAGYEISRVQSVKQRETVQEEYERNLAESQQAFDGRRYKEALEKLYHAWSLPGYENDEQCRALNKKLGEYGTISGIRAISRKELPACGGEEILRVLREGTCGLYKDTQGRYSIRKFVRQAEGAVICIQDPAAAAEPETVCTFSDECRNGILLAVDEGRHAAYFAVSKRALFMGEKISFLAVNMDSGRKIEESGRLFRTMPKSGDVFYCRRGGMVLVNGQDGIRIISVDAAKAVGTIPTGGQVSTIFTASESGEWAAVYDMNERTMSIWNLFDGKMTAQITDPLLCQSEFVFSQDGHYLLTPAVYPMDEVRLYWAGSLMEMWRTNNCELLKGKFLCNDGHILAILSHQAMLLNTQTGETISKVPANHLLIYDHTMFSEDGTILFTPGEKEMWNIDYLYQGWE